MRRSRSGVVWDGPGAAAEATVGGAGSGVEVEVTAGFSVVVGEGGREEVTFGLSLDLILGVLGGCVTAEKALACAFPLDLNLDEECVERGTEELEGPRDAEREVEVDICVEDDVLLEGSSLAEREDDIIAVEAWPEEDARLESSILAASVFMWPRMRNRMIKYAENAENTGENWRRSGRVQLNDQDKASSQQTIRDGYYTSIKITYDSRWTRVSRPQWTTRGKRKKPGSDVATDGNVWRRPGSAGTIIYRPISQPLLVRPSPPFALTCIGDSSHCRL